MYPLPNNDMCPKLNERKYYGNLFLNENFKNIKNKKSIKMIVDRYADLLAQKVFDSSVFECAKFENIQEASDYIISYDYDIKDIMIEMYSDSKNIKGKYFNYDDSYSEELDLFLYQMNELFNQALYLTVETIIKKYDSVDEFVPIMSIHLRKIMYKNFGLYVQ
jgi:hypothetical protein